MDDQNLAVLEKNINQVDNGEKTNQTRKNPHNSSGVSWQKKPVLRSGESLDLRLKATKSCAILTVLPSVPAYYLLASKTGRSLFLWGKTEMQPVLLKGAWMSVHQGEGNVDLKIPYSLFFNYYLFSLPRFILYSLAPSHSSWKEMYTYSLVSHFSFLSALPFCLLVSKC